MKIPSVEIFYLKTVTKDEFGKILSETNKEYGGVIDRQTQWRSVQGGATTVLGEGMVFSSELEGLTEVGQEIIIDGNTYTISQTGDLGALGVYHHTEIIYA